MKDLLRLIQVLSLITIFLLISVIVMQTHINKQTILDKKLLERESFTLSSFNALYDNKSLWIEESKDLSLLKVLDSNTGEIREIDLSYLNFKLLAHDLCIHEDKVNIIGQAGDKTIVFSLDLNNFNLSGREISFESKGGKYYISKNLAFSLDKKVIEYYNLSTGDKNDLYLSNTYKVSKVLVENDLIYIVGQKAQNQTLREGSFAFYSSYDQNGKLLFEYSLKEDSKSYILDILPREQSFILFGKYEEDNSDKGSFFAKIDKEGQIQESNLFSQNEGYYIDQVLSSGDSIISQGINTKEDSYVFHINVIEDDFKKLSTYKFESQEDMKYLLSVGNDKLYGLVNINRTNRYQILSFASIGSFAGKMKTLNVMKGIVVYLSRNVSSILYTYIIAISLYILQKRIRRRKISG